jgi:CheY-like chemotaxis protein
MNFHLCPHCRQVNDADALVCEACGRELAADETVPGALQRSADGRSAGALWLDEPVPPVELTLREIVAMTAAAPRPPTAAAAGDTRAAASPSPLPPLPPLPPIVDDVLLRAVEAAPPEPAASLAGSARSSPADRAAEARAARRAAVRRARLQAAGVAGDDFVPEVMVMDSDNATRDALCSLLRGFGFGVHAVPDAPRAAALIAERPFTAVFVDIALDGADGGHGIEMCRRLHEATSSTALVLVSAPLNTVDRVRAQLLGFDSVLAKPAQRGDVARVLDARGIALPSDARRR